MSQDAVIPLNRFKGFCGIFHAYEDSTIAVNYTLHYTILYNVHSTLHIANFTSNYAAWGMTTLHTVPILGIPEIDHSAGNICKMTSHGLVLTAE